MIIFLIISIILVIVSIVLLIIASKKTLQRKDSQKLIDDYIEGRLKERDLLNKTIISLEQEMDTLQTATLEMQEAYKKSKLLLEEKTLELETFKNDAQKAFNNYEEELDSHYSQVENEIKTKIKQLNNSKELVNEELVQIKNSVRAATAAKLLQEEENNKWLFYSLDLTNEQLNDILELTRFKNRLNDSSLIGKIIWSAFVLKATNNLCNRVLGTDKKCGIYKITNKETKEVYIGQSLSVADRWKAHIKCGLGIDAPTTNKLYNKMQYYGVWMFTFELLEECSKEKLNEREKFWIDFYQSDKIGLNSKGGNK